MYRLVGTRGGTVALRVPAAPSQEDLLSALPIAAASCSNGRSFATIVAINQAAQRYRPENLAADPRPDGSVQQCPRAHYDQRRATGEHHNAALRNFANKLIARMWWCIANNLQWDEHAAWPTFNHEENTAAA